MSRGIPPAHGLCNSCGRLSPTNPPPDRIVAKQHGAWYIGGIRHASVAIEPPDFVVVFEAPLNEKPSIAVIDEVHELIPDKPNRYLDTTPPHFVPPPRRPTT